MISADELLKTKSVPELRKLVSILHDDANSKKIELQHLVGSKYHDFIESADSITEMLEFACVVEDKIPDLWGKNIHGLITSSKDLLANIPQIQSQKVQPLISNGLNNDDLSVGNGDLSLNVSSCNSSAVWKFLEKRDIFNAAKTIMLAELLVGEEIEHRSFSSKESLFDHIQNNFGGARLSVAGVDVSSLQNTLFLKDVVFDEAMMMLLCGDMDGQECSVAEKSKLLSVLSALKGCESDMEVCQMYLNGVTLKVRNMEQQIKTLIQRMREEHKTANDSSSGTIVGEESDGIVQLLKDAILCLQTAIVDMFHLFISPVGSIHSSQFALCSNQLMEGLVGDYLLAADAPNKSNSNKATVKDVAASLVQSYLKSTRTPVSNGAVHSKFVSQWLQTDILPGLSQLCHDWIMLVTQAQVQSSSLGVQQHSGSNAPMTPSANMTAIKNELHMCCLNPLFVQGSSCSSSGYASSMPADSRSKSVDIWKDACSFWFAASSASLSMQQSFLWNSVFRGNFLLQMSELLSSTVLRVVITFNDTYITRYVLNKSCSIGISGSDSESSTKSGVRGVIPFDLSHTKRSKSAGLFTATKIFKVASHCYQFLYQELQSLMLLYFYYARTTAHAFETNGAEAELERATVTKAFSEHMYLLFALIMCILRNFGVSIMKHKQHISSTNGKGSNSSGAADAQASLDTLTNAQLVIGRIVWLINDELSKNSDQPYNISSLLNVNCGSGSSDGSVTDSNNGAGTSGSNLVTENQICSAFEIIDTDGTGCLRFNDINEVLQVLVIDGNGDGDGPAVGRGAGGGSSISRMIRSLLSLNDDRGTQCMTLVCNELICVCGCYLMDMSVPPALILRKNLQASMTDIFTKHSYFDAVDGWIETSAATTVGSIAPCGHVTMPAAAASMSGSDSVPGARSSCTFAAQLAGELLEEVSQYVLSIESRGARAGQQPDAQPLRFQLSWQHVQDAASSIAVSAAGEDTKTGEEEQDSRLPCPTAVSAPLYLLLSRLAGSYGRVFISYDVLTSAQNSILSDGVILSYLRKKLLHTLLAGYDALLVRLKELQSHKTASGRVITQMFESIATQVLFDLMFIRLLFAEDPGPGNGVRHQSAQTQAQAQAQREVEARMGVWEEEVDSITYSLLEREFMQPYARSYYNSVSLAFCPLMLVSSPAELSVTLAAVASLPLNDSDVNGNDVGGGQEDVLGGIFNKSSASLSMFPMLSVPIATTVSSSASSSSATATSHANSFVSSRMAPVVTNGTAPSVLGVSSGSSMLTKAIGSFW